MSLWFAWGKIGGQLWQQPVVEWGKQQKHYKEGERETMNSQLQNFCVESINKEASVRFAWHLKYSKKFAKEMAASSSKKQVTGAELKPNSSLTKRLRNMEKEKPLSPEVHTAKDLSDGTKAATDANKLTPSVLLRDMRPVSPKTQLLLYSGISAHGEGRYAYLNKRNLKSPVEKYEFPVLSSCLYGWKIMEYGIPKSSAYARTSVIRDTFYRPSGIIIR